MIEALQQNPKRHGRKRILTSRDGLALTLAWTRTRGSMFVLQMIFGLTYTAVGVYVKFGRRLLVSILDKDDNAKVSIPSDAKIQSFKNCVQERHPRLVDVWLTMDGLKVYLQQSPESVVQNRYYNRWTHDHYITNVYFAFHIRSRNREPYISTQYQCWACTFHNVSKKTPS